MSDMREAARMIAEAFVDSGRELSERAVKESAEGKSTAVFQGRDSEGKPYVMLPGSDEAMPVSQMAVDAKAGDSVRVSFKDGRALVEANLSDPAAGVGKVDMAQETAEQASGKAESAKAAAANAQVSADAAGIAAASAQGSANQALADAASIRQSAEQAAADAASASASAASASADAASAQASALNALYSLSDVERVVGTVNWIAEHGGYELTEDATVNPSKVYYTRSGTSPNYTYAIVTDPKDSELSTYYELVIDESVQNYIASHIAQTNYGLDLMFDGTSEKVHIGTVDGEHASGVYIVANGQVRSAYTADGATIGPESGFHIDISGTELGFYQGQTKVAYVSNNELNIPRTVVLNAMRLGKWSFVQRDSGNMGLFYTG